jgi:hypothetical protein
MSSFGGLDVNVDNGSGGITNLLIFIQNYLFWWVGVLAKTKLSLCGKCWPSRATAQQLGPRSSVTRPSFHGSPSIRNVREVKPGPNKNGARSSDY